ncbi:hypothetical protein BH11ARM2_BH11ARM2_01490 [soil metagenome]
MIRKVARFFAFFYCLAAIGINVTAEGVLGSMVRVLGVPTLFLWLVSLFEKGSFRRWTSFNVAFLFFLLVQIVSRVWTIDINGTNYIIWRYSLIFGLTLIVYDIFSDSLRSADLGLEAAVFGSLTAALWTIYNWKTGNVYFDKSRYAATGLHPNSTAFIVSIGIPVAADLWRRKALNPFFRTVNGLYIPIALLALVLTGSRGGMLAAAPILLWLFWTVLRSKVGTVALPALAVAFLIYLPTNPELQNNLDRATNIQQAQDDRLSGRTGLWDTAERLFKDSPFIGRGAGSFRYAAGADAVDVTGYAMGAHNSYLEVSVETGMLGVAALVGSLAMGILAASRLPKGHRTPYVLATSIIPMAMFYETFEWYYMPWAYVAVICSYSVAVQAQQVRVVQARIATTAQPA